MKKLIIALLVLCFSLVGCQLQPPQIKVPSGEEQDEKVLTIKDFYPFLANTYLTYDGIGMEFAEREIYFDFIYNGRAQIRNQSTGTTVAQILDYEEGALKLSFSVGDAYYLADYTSGDFKKEREILLMEPIQVGTKWKLPDGRAREITAMNVAIETPSGNYEALEVTTEGYEDTLTKTYYVQGLGMVLTTFQTEDHEIITTLAGIDEETHVTYLLRCYYPDFENERVVYKDFDIAFNTNDRIEPIYAEHLQLPLSQSIIPVFNEKVTIQSFLYDTEENLVVVDLSDNFIAELNAGAGLESLILQSIVNTAGFNFGVDKVVITLGGKHYESGHFMLEEGDHFSTHYEKTVPFE